MSKNINSFAENMRRTVTAQKNTLNILQSMQNAVTTHDTFVAFDYENLKDGSVNSYQLPSYTAITNRLEAIETNFQNMAAGKASITLNDGSRRQIKLNNLPETPARITNLQDPSTFSIDSNWFFEELMFPAVTVKIDLTGKIDDSSDRVKVARIILDSKDNATQNFWINSLSDSIYDYVSLKNLLVYNSIPYSEDIQTIELPLVSNTLYGTFQVMADPEIINGDTWFTLDNIEYDTIDADGRAQRNNILSKGDRLAYSNSLFEIVEIDQNSNKVHLRIINGSAFPGVFSIFTYYQDPFRSKEISVKFGAHEYDIIYVKGVNEDFNLLANEWSTPVKFSSDELVNAANVNQTFNQFYSATVSDWGAQWIAEARERRVSAFYGHIPNAPTLSTSDLRVVQINTQINAALDTADIKNKASQIESTKSQISSLRQTIAAQKTELQATSLTVDYNKLQQEIADNIKDLQNLQAEYKTLVNDFQTSVQENQAVVENPKYHIRGFFPLPLPKFRDDEGLYPEEVIGFEIAYRYICEDNTATQLNTFQYTDTTNNAIVQGTFTDWLITQSAIKQRVFNSESGVYEWVSENVADGSEININQIDIPITKGEKVEIKVRSISEAGYPNNALKSDWSNTIVIAFPNTLSTRNSMADLVQEVNDDALNIAITNNLDSIGVTAHLADTIPNVNSVNGLNFNHVADNIAYEDVKDDGTTASVSLQEKVADLEARLRLLEDYLNKQTDLLR